MIYLAAPRTASRATQRALCKAHGFEQAEGRAHHYCPKKRDIPKGYSIATTVRDHFTALESWWWKMNTDACLQRPRWIEIEDAKDVFLDKQGYFWWTSNVMWPYRKQSGADVILRFESLNADLSAWLGETVEVPPYGALQGHRPRLTEDCREWVREKFHEEREELGYG